jgi:hypothetical protein
LLPWGENWRLLTSRIGVCIAAGLLEEQTIKIFGILQKSQKVAWANYEAQRDFLRSCGSNLAINNGTLVVAYRYPWRYIVENRGNKKWGPYYTSIRKNFAP